LSVIIREPPFHWTINKHYRYGQENAITTWLGLKDYRIIYKESVTLRLFLNLTPFIPLSFSRRGGRGFREGRSPLSNLHSPFPYLLREGGQGDRLVNDL
jgi:hypothetical protein